MSGAHTSLLALLVAASVSGAACGEVPMDEQDPDAMPSGMKTYQATLAASGPSMFGGTTGYPCKYTMTLRQIQLQLVADATGKLVSGSAQNMTEEAVVNVGECPYLPANPTTQKFTFKSATPVGASTMVVMEGDAGNAPKTTLAITLTPTSGSYTAASRWTRTDQVPDLTWTVTANLMLTVK